jgi:hypothetical protein
MGYGCIWQDLLGWLDKQPRSVRHRPQLSENIQTLMQEAWLTASSRRRANPQRASADGAGENQNWHAATACGLC